MIDPSIEALIAAATEAGANGLADDDLSSNHEPDRSTLAASKLHDALVDGFEAEFSPHEAEAAGAFLEDALDELEAREADPALPRFQAALLSPKACS